MLPARLRVGHTTTATDRAREKSRLIFLSVTFATEGVTLEYAESKCAGTAANASPPARRTAALAVFDKQAGKFKSVKFNRAELYDR